MDTNLKIRREKMGLTQVQVAKKARVTEVGYQNYEYGKRVPDAHTAQRIAQALGSTVEDLFPLPTTATNGIEKQPDGNRA